MTRTDSAGQSWHERQLVSTGFDTDDGMADPALLAALDDASPTGLMAAVSAARLLVAVVAVRSGEARASDGLTQDTSVDMALVVLTGPDDVRALPVFSSVAALTSWNRHARPVPVTAARAGQAAVAEGCAELVLDPGAPTQRTLRASMVWALAQQRPWQPAHEDPHVDRSVADALGGEPEVTAYDLSDGLPSDSGVLRVGLVLRSGLEPEQVRALVTRVGERLATDGELRARVDGLAFAIAERGAAVGSGAARPGESSP